MDDTPWIEPPAACELASDEIHFWRADLNVQFDNLLHWERLLSPDEIARANRFVFAKDRAHYVAARGILRQLLGKYLALPATHIRFAYTAHGKPFLRTNEGERQLQFNVTHSGELALYAFNWDGRVGIDIELVRSDLPFASLMDSIFTARERATIAALSEEQARYAFFTGWTRKEAYIKARGEGLSYPLDHFEVSVLPHEPFVLRLSREDEDAAQWSCCVLNAGPDYAAAAVSEGSTKISRYYRFSACQHP